MPYLLPNICSVSLSNTLLFPPVNVRMWICILNRQFYPKVPQMCLWNTKEERSYVKKKKKSSSGMGLLVRDNIHCDLRRRKSHVSTPIIQHSTISSYSALRMRPYKPLLSTNPTKRPKAKNGITLSLAVIFPNLHTLSVAPKTISAQ